MNKRSVPLFMLAAIITEALESKEQIGIIDRISLVAQRNGLNPQKICFDNNMGKRYITRDVNLHTER